MKVLLAIPSKNRWETLQRYTMAWLKNLDSTTEYRVFVEPQDAMEYEFVVPDGHLEVLEENNRGLGYAKCAIRKYAEENGFDLIFKIDDDIRCFTNYRTSFEPIQAAIHFDKMLKQFVACFEANEQLGIITFPYSHEMWEPKQWIPNKRAQTSYLIRTELLINDQEIHIFEDFATSLWVQVQGKKVMGYGLFGINCGVKIGGGKGGYQSEVFDRTKQTEQSIAQLRKIYPPLRFKPVDKPWKIEPDLSSVKL